MNTQKKRVRAPIGHMPGTRGAGKSSRPVSVTYCTRYLDSISTRLLSVTSDTV